MTDTDIFKSNPLLKLAIPLMAGIAVGWHGAVGLTIIYALFSLSVVSMLFGLSRRVPVWLFGAGALLAMFSIGLFVESGQRSRMQDSWCDSKLCYEAQLLEVPAVRGSSVKALAKVSLPDTSRVRGVRGEGLVTLYFQRTVDSGLLEVGDNLLFETVVRNPENAGNPAEFDNEYYSYVNGVTGSAYLRDGDWRYCGRGDLSLYMRAMLLRDRIVSMYRDLGFGGDGLALLSALTVGEKRDFPQELKESYSAAGASHVLALSGLHLGILYMLLMFLMPRVYDIRLSILKELVVVIVIWGFAFVAGLSPSVTRAAILFTLMSFCKLCSRDSSSLNSLAFAAIVMLVVEPHLLFNISFQLSFSAVFSILCIMPPMRHLVNADGHGRIYRSIVDMLLLSFAAQVGTLPFIWYYFGVFPLYFLLTNLFVVPLAFAVVALAILVWVLAFLPAVQSCVAWVLSCVIEIMNGGVVFVASLPGGSFALPSATLPVAFCVASLLLLLAVALVRCKWWLLAFVSLSATVLSFFYYLEHGEDPPEDYIVIYNNRKNPLVHLVMKDKTNLLVSTVPCADAEYEYSSVPFVKRERLPVPLWMWGCDSLHGVRIADGVFTFAGLKLCMLDNPLWMENQYVEPVDILLLCRGFLGNIKELMEVYPTNCILIDASLYRHSRNRIIKECAAMGIAPVDISHTGALRIVSSDDGFEIHQMRGK